jgi:hypothetical protein
MITMMMPAKKEAERTEQPKTRLQRPLLVKLIRQWDQALFPQRQPANFSREQFPCQYPHPYQSLPREPGKAAQQLAHWQT